MPIGKVLPGVAILCQLLVPMVASAQSCTWGGTSAFPPPIATPLRSAPGPSGSAPGRVATDELDRLYVASPRTGTITVSDHLARPVSAIQGLMNPTALAVESSQRVYVGEAGRGRVAVFDDKWLLIDSLGIGDGEFVLPVDIAFDFDALEPAVYIVDAGAHQVRVYSSSGAHLRDIGGKGTALGQFDFPVAIHIGVSGQIYVADQNNDRIQSFDRLGNLLACFGSRSTAFGRRFGRLQALAGDAQGRIYVADAFQSNVRVFDPDGVLLTTIGTLGVFLGELRTPTGLVIDSYNRLFVASHNNQRLEIFGLDAYTDPTWANEVMFKSGFEFASKTARSVSP